MREILIPFLLFTATLRAAELPNMAAVGVSYNHGAAPAVAGTGLYAKKIADTGTYAFTVMDALPVSVAPFAVTTQFGVGIAQRVVTIAGKVPIYIPTSAGISYTGSNTGWAWSTGGLASINIGQSWRICPTVRAVKSSVSAGQGYSVIVGMLFGWGW